MFYVVEAIYSRNASNGALSLYSTRVDSSSRYFKVAQRKAAAKTAECGINGVEYLSTRVEYLAMSPSAYAAWVDGKTREVRNLMSGELVRESVTTPYSCSVASESYWSM